MSKNVILLSGGLDSATLLAHALAAGDKVFKALTFDYGQRAQQEIVAAAAVSNHYGIPHTIKLLGPLFGPSALTTDQNVPTDPDPDDPEARRAITVPGRNILFLAHAVGEALKLGANGVLFAAHDSGARTVPDCRLPFVDPINTAVAFAYEVQIRTPFIMKSKTDIVRLAKELDVPTHLTWSCYAGDETPCDVCRACIERREAEEQV